MVVISKSQRTAALFRSNRSQAVRLPKDFEFPSGMKRVVIRKEGDAIVIEPAKNFWKEFFDQAPCPDFPERGDQGVYEERESFDD